MSKVSRLKSILLLLFPGLLFMGMKSGTNYGDVHVVFENYFGDQKLVLDSVKYRNALGQELTISNFKYYLGNFILTDKNGERTAFNNYYLVKQDDDISKSITLPSIPKNEFVSLDFIIGVDSAHNCSGAQDGALDPVNGMFWAWNTGYIFAKLEGNAASSVSPGHIFEFHIGGYKAQNNCIRKIHVDLSGSHSVVEDETSSIIHLKADAAEFMKTPTTIDLSKMSSVTGPQNATMIADNYKDMFSLIKVENGK